MSISIITACRNSALTIEDCIRSVQGQSVHAKHIVVDGLSADGTVAVVRECSDPNLKLISEVDKGVYDAMNKGVVQASGDVVGILNSDDFYVHDKVLENVMAVFKDPSIDACYGDIVYAKDCVTPENWRNHIVRYWKAGSFSARSFYWGWMPPHPTFFVRRRIYDRCGNFNLAMGSSADYELMLRFLLKHGVKVAYIPEILVCMRVGGIGNRSVVNRIRANQFDKLAWKINGLKPYPWTLWCKPLRKLPQWWKRPAI